MDMTHCKIQNLIIVVIVIVIEGLEVILDLEYMSCRRRDCDS